MWTRRPEGDPFRPPPRRLRRLTGRAPKATAAIVLATTVVFGACRPKDRLPEPHVLPLRVERMDPAMDRLVPPSATVEVLAAGFAWAEGPVWVVPQGMLLFSDVPNNRVHAWRPETGTSLWLEPSGYTGDDPAVTNGGANGLLIDPDGHLVLCQHGDRRLVRMDGDLAAPSGRFSVLADSYQGKRLNSPNDAVLGADGSIWFTDPPYGLAGEDGSPERELPFSGVYRRAADGELSLVTDTLDWPNGIGLSPDGRTLYVANTDPRRAWYVAYDLDAEGTATAGRLLFDATSLVAGTNPGLPDGLKVHPDGTLFATGPGGVLLIAPDGRHLGTIRTDEAAANVAFGADAASLFVAATSRLIRVRL